MSLPDAEELHKHMENFESNPKNLDYAYVLFRELNKHGMYLTVVRIYNKHNFDRFSGEKKAEFIKSQFEYARDNIE